MRIVKSKDGRVALDLAQRGEGRGAYVHRDAACIEDAIRRGGLARTLRARIPAEVARALREGQEGRT